MAVKHFLRIVCVLIKDFQGSYDGFATPRTGVADIRIEDPNLGQILVDACLLIVQLTRSPGAGSLEWTTNLRAADDSIRDSNCDDMKISGGKLSHFASCEALTERLDL